MSVVHSERRFTLLGPMRGETGAPHHDDEDPIWSAEAVLLQCDFPNDTDRKSLGFRSLFLNAQAAENHTLLPGTALVHVHIHSVTLQVANQRWRIPVDHP